MRLFSFLLWLAWAAIGVRVLLAPFWPLIVNEGMFLLLVAAPGVAILGGANWLVRHAPSGGV